MNQTIDLVGDLNERAKLRQVADLAFDDTADRMGYRQLLPRIALGLTEGQTDAPL